MKMENAMSSVGSGAEKKEAAEKITVEGLGVDPMGFGYEDSRERKQSLNLKEYFTSLPKFTQMTWEEAQKEPSGKAVVGDGYLFYYDQEGNRLLFKKEDIEWNEEKKGYTIVDKQPLCLAYTKHEIQVPISENERIKSIQEAVKNDTYKGHILNGRMSKEQARKIIESAGLEIPDYAKDEIHTPFATQKTDYNPSFNLKKKDADVSYRFDDNKFERKMNIYEDNEKNTWYEISKQPRKQVFLSLLAKPLFNASQVLEVRAKGDEIIDQSQKEVEDTGNKGLFSRIKEGLAGKKEAPKFLSKELDFNELPDRPGAEARADYVVFRTIFESNNADRDFFRGHNIRRGDDSYAIFDYDQSSIDDRGENRTKQNAKFFIKEIKYNDRGYVDGDLDRDYEKRPFPRLMNEISLKLEETDAFFSGPEGRRFFDAVLKKSGFLDEKKLYAALHTTNDNRLKKKIEKLFADKLTHRGSEIESEIEKMYESNPEMRRTATSGDEIYEGLFAKMRAGAKAFQEEMSSLEKEYVEAIGREKYDEIMIRLQKVAEPEKDSAN